MGAESPVVAVRRRDCRCRAALRAQLSCSEELPAHHPDIGQRKQGVELSGVLRQPAVADLAVAELPLDHPEGVLAAGAHPRLEMLDPVTQLAGWRIAQRRRLPGFIATCHSTRRLRSGRWSTPM